MLEDKNWDEREGDSYKTIYSVLTDLVLVAWWPGGLVAWFAATKSPLAPYTSGLKDLFFWNAC